MNLQDITNDSSDFDLEKAMNDSSVEIQKATDHLKALKEERAIALKAIVEDRGDFQIGTTKVYLGVKKKAKQAAAIDIINEIADKCDDVFGTIVKCLGSGAFKKGATQKLIGKNEMLFWDDEDETVTEKIVKEVNTDFL